LLVMGGSTLLGNGEEAEIGEGALAEGETPTSIGYVDQADLIERIPPSLPEELFVPFPDVTSANSALLEEEQEVTDPSAASSSQNDIDAYYVIPPDYRESGEVRYVRRELPAGQQETGAFDRLLLANLLPDVSEAQLTRLREPFQSAQLQIVQLGPQGEETTEGNMFTPFLLVMVVMIPLFMSGGYLLYSLTEEKSNRVMEILLISLKPRDLLAGKLLGLGVLTFVQYVAWAAIGLAALFITGQTLGSLLGVVNLSGSELVLFVLYGLGGYWLYAGLMAGIGALSPDLESSRTWTFVITLPMLIPIYLWVSITSAPQGVLAVTLSFIPFSSPLAMLMRMASTTVPDWQVITSLALLLFTAAGIVWLMARLFRVQTLLSGESFSIGRFWHVLREG
ncbi:MAG: ABC transporter permease, partial [Chloroflexota bacterium]